MEEKTLDMILHDCTVRLVLPGKKGYGTGFFVAAGLILTCAHVVEDAQQSNTSVEANYSGKIYIAQILKFLPDLDLDLALLQIDLTNHPAVLLHKEVKPFSKLYSFGYPDNNLSGEPTTFDTEGWTGDQPKRLKFKSGQVRPGMSGSPLLNWQTGSVCGLVQVTRDRNQDLGGKAVLTDTVLREFPEVIDLQQEFHQRDRRWIDCLDLQQRQQLNLETLQPTMMSNFNSIHNVIGVPPPTHSGIIEQRTEVVKNVHTKLTAPDTTGIILTGIGGIGKSTLAALVYRHAEEERQNGKGRFIAEPLWLTIEPATTMADLAETLLMAFNKEIPNFGNLTSQQQSIALFNIMNTTDKARLVILDQFENLLDLQTGQALKERPGIGEWLDVLNGQQCVCRILLTSRLWPRGTHELPPTFLQEYDVQGLDAIEGASLLRKQGVEVTRGTDVDLRQAVVRCEGHALALTLLAGILRYNRSLNMFLLFNDPLYAPLWSGDIAGRLLDYIYTDQLSEPQRRLLLAFSVYREPVTLNAAQSLIAEVPKAHILPALNVLLAQHLLNAAGEGYYQLHAIIADYARDHFAEDNEQALQAAHWKAAQYYLQEAAKLCPPTGIRQGISDVHLLIEAIWQLCKAGKWQEAHHFMQEQHIFIDLRRWGGNATLLELYQLLFPLERWHPEYSQEALIYSNLGQIRRTVGQKELALKDFEQALSIYRKLEDRERIGTILHYISRAYDAVGQKELAIENGEEALRILREVGDRDGQARALNNLGHIFWKAGRNEQAQKCFEEALNLYQQLDDQAGEGETLKYLGWIFRDMGLALREPDQKEQAQAFYEQARAFYERALILLREVKNHGEEGRALNDLGRISMLLDQKEQAIYYWEESLRIFEEVGDRSYKAVVLNNLGRIFTSLDQKEKARDYLKQALNIRREIDDLWAEGRTLQDIGILYLKQHSYDVASAAFVLAQNIFQVEYPSSRELTEVQRQIDFLLKEVGDEKFDALLARVKPQAFQIVQLALDKME
jgi:tetratricopeptide (TPR) repeat protein